MILITAKLTQFAGRDNDDDGPCLDAALESLLTSSLLEDDLTGDKTSLDQVRKAYLLAFYELHQSPGHSSWLRISKVTRMAYRLGLDRLDQVRVLYPDWNAVSDEDTEEWRALWWRIYRLDTYSNLASGTPYLIDEMIINTTISLTRTEDGVIQGILLPPHSDGLLEIIPAIISNKETLLDNIHTVTTAIMRQVGRVIRMHMLQWHDRVMLEAGNTEQRLATLCLALPLGWLNPQRNAFANEGAGDHHARLITVFHLRMAQLLLSIVECGHRREDDWLPSWQRVLSTSRDIATLAYQWDSAFCLSVDPAITFILFTALVFLDLHRKSSTSDENLRYNLSKDVTVLQLQLKHFGSFWMQARLLTCMWRIFPSFTKWDIY
ncbi:hypothetical protein N7478_010302 [Penicillium angulare]|uniref:uncharacterized protein n=1 Tax=Penicillium angulare TaxID=116970 RepID=UPI0025419D44|nr:uncharacterized protein N7478_010302 [Penicillium angulare]KAJ5267494.1 hypothetical protein N7478_010302 [Penicillium angulare]